VGVGFGKKAQDKNEICRKKGGCEQRTEIVQQWEARYRLE
jgi:hypothetical protein